ncbi:unnamed protein product [Chironomus riparius]|uniref:DUF4604 domain-containing protein n=1 Tax=Chironomus riparius TaxID=315576 RepID=A0A9N9RMM2_9DIPT|nr:unnamed protein product [Chironomus riparius]
MSKRNVAFIKPDEPAFLKRMKQQIGYQEPDTVEAKRGPVQNLGSSDEDEDYEERDDEKPQVIQLKKGDLTEEEAIRIAKEEAEKPADLNQRVIFKSKKKKDDAKDTVDEDKLPSNTVGKSDKKPKKERKQEKPVKNLLSFVEDD